MLNIFFNNSDNNKLRMFRTAEVQDSENNRTKFKFSQLSREDITEIKVLKDVDMEESQITIMTTSNFPFKTLNKIFIDSKLYIVSSIYKENQEQANGMFRNNIQPFVYLVLRK